MSKNLIPVERLTIGSTITITDAAWGRTAYRVEDIEFDGEVYAITYGDERDWTDTTYVRAGGCVDAVGELRDEASIPKDEWDAKAEALSADTDHLLGQINAAQGYQLRTIDQRPLYEAVADALGVDAREVA